MTSADPTGRWPHPSRRMPVAARRVVATSQPLAAQAGLDAMREGGNAVDAALAAAIALTVVEPTSNGIGGDAFAIVADDGGLAGLNGSGRSPRAWTPARFAGRRAMPARGADSVTVPGAPDAWRRASERFGALPFERLFAPAIRYAREGFAVGPITAWHWRGAERLAADFPEFARVFLPGNRAPRAGEIVRLPEHADTLAEIAATRAESFYRGPLAAKIATAVREAGGALDAEDLAAHAGEWVAPIATRFAGVDVHEIPPNGQGLAALVALGILERLDPARIDPDSPDGLHLLLEATKRGLVEARRHVADPAYLELPPAALLDGAALDRAAAAIDPRRASFPEPTLAPGRGTVTLAAADGAGRAVAWIQSNYHGFGSGLVVPGTGIALQNRALGFALEEGHPNRVGGGKRPFHTILPGLVTRAGRPETAFGWMGGAMQAQGHVQLVVRVHARGEDPQAASDAPRWFLEEDGGVVLEEGFAPRVAEALRARGHRVREGGEFGLFGGAQIVTRNPHGGWIGASDSRKDGQAVGD